MNLEFPTHFPVPSYPTRPTEDAEAGPSGFLEALKGFFQQLVGEHTSTSRHFQDADFCIGNGSQESVVSTCSTDVAQEALFAVAKNIAHPSKGEYVWDAALNRWILKLRQM